MSFPTDDPRVECGPAECIQDEDHTEGHFKWRESSDLADQFSWRINGLRWNSGVSEQLQGPHPGRHRLTINLWSSSEDDAECWSIIPFTTVPANTYRQVHSEQLKATAKRLREIADEMDKKAQGIIESKSGVEFPGDKP